MTSIMAMQIDSREDTWLKNWQQQPPALFTGVPIMTTMLEIGDARIWCEDGSILSVERKTPSDFLNSIPNDHIFDQVSRMMEDNQATGAVPYLVITGEILRNNSTGNCIIPGSKHGEGWNWHSVQGALLSIQECGVPVVFCAGDNDYSPTLERLASRGRGGIKINPRREIIALSPQEAVLTSFPGIGPELAAEIMRRCSSLAWALDYLTDLTPDAPKIAGIGAGKKQQIVKLMGLDEGNSLAVILK